MTCPYCNTTYSSEESCFCHPPVQSKPVQPAPLVAAPQGDHDVPAVMEPTGLSNPFWN
jgi:hypothetical protein